MIRAGLADDGKGFDFDQVISASDGLGLKTLDERIKNLGGKIQSVGDGPVNTWYTAVGVDGAVQVVPIVLAGNR